MKTLTEAPRTITELGGILLNWLHMAKQLKDPVISLSRDSFTVTARSLFMNQSARTMVIKLTIAEDGRYYSHLDDVSLHLPLEATNLVKLICLLEKQTSLSDVQ